jgi:hypothetical protein
MVPHPVVLAFSSMIVTVPLPPLTLTAVTTAVWPLRLVAVLAMLTTSPGEGTL